MSGVGVKKAVVLTVLKCVFWGERPLLALLPERGGTAGLGCSSVGPVGKDGFSSCASES